MYRPVALGILDLSILLVQSDLFLFEALHFERGAVQDRSCWRLACVPAGVSAEVVLTRAAAARPRRPDCCQPESGVPTPEGSACGPMKAKLCAGSKDRRGHSPRTPRGETPQRGKQHTGKPTRQHLRTQRIRSGRDQDRSGRDQDRSNRDQDRSGRDQDRSGRDQDQSGRD